MNSSRTRFGRISIKAKLPVWGENRVWTGARCIRSERLLRRCERANARAVRRERESARRGSERKGLRVHSANGSRRPRSETAFRATLDWFWRSRAAFLEVGSGHFRFYVTPALSFSLFLIFPLSRTCWEYATGPHRRRYIASRRSSSALINEL